MIQFFKSLLTAIAKAIKPPKDPQKFLQFRKRIASWRTKSQEQIYEILEAEVDYIKRKHPDYKLMKFSKPRFDHLEGIYYILTFKRKSNVSRESKALRADTKVDA